MAKVVERAATQSLTTTDDGYAVGRKPSASAHGGKLPNFGERTQTFRLSAHPTSWELVKTSKGWRLVPTLKRLALMPGVNWTKPARKGEGLDASDVEAKARNTFGQIVLTDIDEYMVEYDGANGTRGYFLTWDRLRTYSDGHWEVSFDQDGYDLWRWSLVTSKRMDGPRESVVSQIRTRLRRAKERAMRTPHLAAAQQARDDAEARLQGLDEALGALRQLSAASAASAA